MGNMGNMGWGWGVRGRHDQGSGSGGTGGSGGAKASATSSYHNGGVEGDAFASWYDEHLSGQFSNSGGTKGSGSGGTKGSSDSVRESFEWDLAPDPNDPDPIDNHDDLSRGFIQNTGHVDVTFSVLGASAGAVSEFYTSSQNTDGIVTDGSPADPNSAMSSFLSSPTGEGESASYELSFSAPVTNVSFRINDVDTDALARVQAFDADGNQIEIVLTAGSGITLSDTDAVAGNDMGDSIIGDVPSSAPEASMLVDIAGPVSRIVIDHAQDGPAPTGIDVTDVYFDVALEDDGDGDGSSCEKASASDSYHNGGVEGPAFAQWYDDNLAGQYGDADDAGADDTEGADSGGTMGSGGTEGAGSDDTEGFGADDTDGADSGGTEGDGEDDTALPAGDTVADLPMPSLEDIMSLMILPAEEDDPSMEEPEIEDIPEMMF